MTIKVSYGPELIRILKQIEEQRELLIIKGYRAAEAVDIIEDCLKECPKAKKYYKIDRNQFRYANKVQLIREYNLETMCENLAAQTINTFDDGIKYWAPCSSGLYFLGETHFNPFTNETFYWVKIGKSSNLEKRMRQYNTCNPMLWRIDFAIGQEDFEDYYHYELAKIATAKCNHNEEWFLVNRETYLEMCEKGFSYFD